MAFPNEFRRPKYNPTPLGDVILPGKNGNDLDIYVYDPEWARQRQLEQERKDAEIAEKLAYARDLIQSRHLAAARRILLTTDHPIAIKWLHQIDQYQRIAPQTSQRIPRSNGSQHVASATFGLEHAQTYLEEQSHRDSLSTAQSTEDLRRLILRRKFEVSVPKPNIMRKSELQIDETKQLAAIIWLIFLVFAVIGVIVSAIG